MLTRFYADNYRSFVDFELRPEKFCLLLGKNGSGKSSLFDALSAIRRFVIQAGDLSTNFPRWSLARWEERPLQRFEVEGLTPHGPFSYVLELEHPSFSSGPPEGARIREERISVEARVVYRFSDQTARLFKRDGSPGPSFPCSDQSSFLPTLVRSDEYGHVSDVVDWFRRVLFFRLEVTSLRKAFITQPANNGTTLDSDGGNLAAFCRRFLMQHPDRAEALRGDLSAVIGGFRYLRFLPLDQPGREVLQVQLEGEGLQPHVLSAGELSEGQVVLLALYAILHGHELATRPLVLFDEPDNFVALPEIRPWLVAFSEIVHRSELQALVISHHPEVVDLLAPECVLWFDRVDAGRTRVRAAESMIDLDRGLRLSELVAEGAFETSEPEPWATDEAPRSFSSPKTRPTRRSSARRSVFASRSAARG